MKFIALIIFSFGCFTVQAQIEYPVLFNANQITLSDSSKKNLAEIIKYRTINFLVLENKEKQADENLTSLRMTILRQYLISLGLTSNQIRNQATYIREPNALTKEESPNTQATINIRFNLAANDPMVAQLWIDTPIIYQVKTKPRKKNVPIVVAQKIEDKKKMTNGEGLKAEQFKKNERIKIPNLIFEGGTHYLMPKSVPSLNQLLEIMKERPGLKIELQGHICCMDFGRDGYDPATQRANLSEMRAKVVFDYLVANGIAAERMRWVGFGSQYKIYPNDSNPYFAEANRRVEILVLEND